MKSTREKEFSKLLASARKNMDHISFGWALLDVEQNKGSTELWEEFKKDPIYKKLIIKSLKRFREMVLDTERTVSKYGFYDSEHYEDEDFYNDNKQILHLLEEEAKKLKLNL